MNLQKITELLNSKKLKKGVENFEIFVPEKSNTARKMLGKRKRRKTRGKNLRKRQKRNSRRPRPFKNSYYYDWI